ncbi:HD domain-containing protein [Halorarius halobius]|uniref:HD domain-containing protein n=1 Tax=Halorarius halobius TaxID=2962671 RepID=UPI0020CF38A6|nr:HD family hydrolase [Halorarius halobius]
MPAELDALLEALELKDERRTGWVLRGIENPESVAAHTWSVATLCLLYADDAGVDRARAVEMALLHDLGEARTGDVATRAEPGEQTTGNDEKVAAERDAVTDMLDPFGDELLALWEAYEARETATARFVKDMDLLDNCLQALAYERGDRYDPDEENDAFTEYEHLDEFFATAAPRFRTAVGEALFERVTAAYGAELGRDVKL